MIALTCRFKSTVLFIFRTMTGHKCTAVPRLLRRQGDGGSFMMSRRNLDDDIIRGIRNATSGETCTFHCIELLLLELLLLPLRLLLSWSAPGLCPLRCAAPAAGCCCCCWPVSGPAAVPSEGTALPLLLLPLRLLLLSWSEPGLCPLCGAAPAAGGCCCWALSGPAAAPSARTACE